MKFSERKNIVTPRETLEKARELLSDRERWTKRYFSEKNGEAAPLEEADQ